jgi:uncharacterized protein YneF (UPF0154 family)
MKKWTIQLVLLIGMAVGIFLVSRSMVREQQTDTEIFSKKASALEKMKKAVSLRGIGRNLLDFHK